MPVQNLNHCGCCEGLSVEVPVQVYNRPGLKAITYRVGVQPQFRESLLASLTTSGLRGLGELTTRDNDDFTIALLDAWATVADVITFYQERIANELYLGTATERFSLIELTKLIGYKLRPGIAASTYLAFTLDENAASSPFLPGGGRSTTPELPSVNLEMGIKVQSVPGPDEEAQTFETIEKIEARPEWNAIRPRLTQPQQSISYDNIVVIKGTNSDLKAGDIVLILQGNSLSENVIPKKIVDVEPKEEEKTDILKDGLKTTWIYFNSSNELPSFSIPLYDKGNINAYSSKVPLSSSIVDDIISKTWREEDLSTLIKTQGWSEADLKESVAKKIAEQPASGNSIFVFRKRAAVFGYNAPKQPTYMQGVLKLPDDWAEWPLKEKDKSENIYLETVYEQVLPGSYIAVQTLSDKLESSKVYQANQVEHRSRTDYGISTKSTVVSIGSQPPWANANDLSAIRDITIYAQSIPLPLAEAPITNDISGDTLMLSRLYLGLRKGQKIILSGDRSDLKGTRSSELRTLKEVLIVNGFTVLKFDTSLTWSYLRSTVQINANVAAATHGETVKEILGSGDATKTFQKFTLKQSPLTFTGATTVPSGIESTLQIRVNDLLWKEVSALYEHGPEEHIYTTEQDDQGKTTIIFGDGKNGARLPSGPENVKATYRKGIGIKGLMKPDQLSQLIARPLGVKGVTNPLPATDATDPEQLEDVKHNATRTIFTLDRIVSLKDYEDFARSYGSISKSLATWVWAGQKRSVHLTVAGYKGSAVDTTGLSNAIKEAVIPDEVPVTIASYQPRFFRVTAAIKVHPDYLEEKVLTAAEQQLRETFSFDNRAFGQPVVYSEVIAILQNVEGILSVDVKELHPSDQAPGLPAKGWIEARITKSGSSTFMPAELLMIDLRALNLQLMP